MTDKKLAVVIATNRPAAFSDWFDAWMPELRGTAVYAVEDAPQKSEAMKFLSAVGGWKHYSWAEIDADLEENAWIIPRRTSAIKSYGFVQAYGDGADYIWTLDDDCFPEKSHADWPYVPRIKQVIGMSQADDSWYNTIEDSGLYPRGYPYGIRQDKKPVMIHHGLWSGIPDLDGVTALEHHARRLDPANDLELVPSGKFFPMCGMNLVFRREMVPAMYFGLQGRERNVDHNPIIEGTRPLPFDRFDDIWAGLFVKKVCDRLNYAVTSGAPSILHTKLSDPTMRVIKEGPGIAINELLWQHVASADLSGCDSVQSCYLKLADDLDLFQPAGYEKYFGKLAEAMRIWTEMFG